MLHAGRGPAAGVGCGCAGCAAGGGAAVTAGRARLPEPPALGGPGGHAGRTARLPACFGGVGARRLSPSMRAPVDACTRGGLQGWPRWRPGWSHPPVCTTTYLPFGMTFHSREATPCHKAGVAIWSRRVHATTPAVGAGACAPHSLHPRALQRVRCGEELHALLHEEGGGGVLHPERAAAVIVGGAHGLGRALRARLVALLRCVCVCVCALWAWTGILAPLRPRA